MEPVTIIIETPKGSSQKYNYDEKLRLFKLTKVLPAGMVFPYDFGFILGTKGEDGDPLDIIIISEIETFTGCIMDCRVIGSIMAEQTEENGECVRNDRFLGIPLVSAVFKDVHSIKQLEGSIVKDIEDFFKNDNIAAGKVFNVKKEIDAEEAYTTIKAG